MCAYVYTYVALSICAYMCVYLHIYIQDSLSKYSNNLFYIARTYKKAGKIIATWIYKSQIYIETNNNNKILILNETQLNNFI